MGFFSSLFGGGKQNTANDEQAQALRKFFDEKLPKNYVNSKKYAVSITQGDRGYLAKVVLDMGADGSDFSGFGKDDYAGLAEMESDYVLDLLTQPPVPVRVTFEMDFGGKNKITMEKGRIA